MKTQYKNPEHANPDFLQAIKAGDFESVKDFVLNKGANVNALDNFMTPAFAHAIHSMNPQMIDFFLAQGAHVNPDEYKHVAITPLGAACSIAIQKEMKFGLVLKLLSLGAHLNPTNCLSSPLTATISANGKDSAKLAEFLVSNGANINPTLDFAITPLAAATQIAATKGKTDLYTKCVDLGAKINPDNSTQVSPLLAAIQSGGDYAVNIMKDLIRRGADIINSSSSLSEACIKNGKSDVLLYQEGMKLPGNKGLEIPSNVTTPKPKIFYIHGNDTEKGYSSDVENYLLREEALTKVAEVINIGTRKNGFNPDKLKEAFAEHLSPTDPYVNIIINAHGGTHRGVDGSKNDFFNLGTFKHENSPQNSLFGATLLEILKEATGSKPLKILVGSCHSNLLQRDLFNLPVGSMLITVANEEEASITSDFYSKNTKTLLDIINNAEGGFKIENLLLPICVNQYKTQNNPMIGIKGKYKDISYDVESFVTTNHPYHFNNMVLDLLFTLKDVPTEHIGNMLNNLSSNPLVVSKMFKIPQESFWQNTIEQYVTDNNYSELKQKLSTYVSPNPKLKKIEKLKYLLIQSKAITEEIENLSIQSKAIAEEIENLSIQLNTAEELLVTKEQLDRECEQLDPNYRKIKENMESKLTKGVMIADANDACMEANAEFNGLFKHNLDEYLDSFSIKNQKIASLLRHYSDLRNKLTNLSTEDQVIVGNIIVLYKETQFKNTKINQEIDDLNLKLLSIKNCIEIVTIGDTFEPDEVVLNYSILLTVGAAKVISYFNHLLSHDSNFHNDLLQNMDFVGQQDTHELTPAGNTDDNSY